MEASKNFTDTLHQVVDHAADGAGTWLKSVSAAVARHPWATALIGLSAGYLIASGRGRSRGRRR